MNTDQNSSTAAPAMTKCDWFTLFLRFLGVWELIAAFERAVTILDINAGNWQSQSGADITHGLATLLVGISLLIAAPTIARAFYPGRRSQPDSNGTPPDCTACDTRRSIDAAPRNGKSHAANSPLV